MTNTKRKKIGFTEIQTRVIFLAQQIALVCLGFMFMLLTEGTLSYVIGLSFLSGTLFLALKQKKRYALESQQLLSNSGSTNLTGIALANSDDANTNLAQIDNKSSLFQQVVHHSFEGQDLSGVSLILAKLESANVNNADLRNANLSSANLNSTQLVGANLSSANLSDALLVGANLTSANLNGVYLWNANLNNAQLVGADLSGAYMSCVKLRNANLSSAVLLNANLSDARLRDADLSGANLSSANLSCANLKDVNLTDANLESANLEGANLEGANLSGVNLKCVKINQATKIDVKWRLEGEIVTPQSESQDFPEANLQNANF